MTKRHVVYHYENEREEFIGSSRFRPKSERNPRGYRYWRCFRHKLKSDGTSPVDCRETYKSELAFKRHLLKTNRAITIKRRQHTPGAR